MLQRCVDAQINYVCAMLREEGRAYITDVSDEGLHIEDSDEETECIIEWKHAKKATGASIETVHAARELNKQRDTLRGFLPRVVRMLKQDISELGSKKYTITFYKNCVLYAHYSCMSLYSFESWEHEIEKLHEDMLVEGQDLLTYVRHFPESFMDRETCALNDLMQASDGVTRTA